ncbi:gustatory receptor for sugar taste 64e-like [Folsomia candida]|uniref:gustatory receptor for sugar taste 64e-like n=1 Tax=Folsomia candida TaxID=158441 RepID=UPI001604BA2B|nr:gustatory receptor for sugar taste 64e-like [Folsomia candida]
MESPVSSALKPIYKVGKYFGLLPIPPKFLSPSPPTTTVPTTTIPTTTIVSRHSHLLLPLYSAYVLVSNLTVLGFAIVIFFRELSSPDRNLVEQFLDMVYHSHILITITVCIHQSRHNISENLADWNKLEVLFETFENCGNSNPRESVSFRKSINLPTSFADLIEILPRNDQKKHNKFITLSKWLTVIYVGVIFVGAVSYFITISINENTSSISSYLDEAAKIYVIEEWCTWWSGIYVIFIGHTMELIWAYGDMLLVLFSLCMSYQFKRFNRIVEKACTRQKIGNIHPRDIEDLRLFHWEIAKVIKKTNKILSVLTSTVFTCNILYLFSRVFNGIEADLKHPTIIATKFSSETTKSFKVLDAKGDVTNSETEYLLMDRFCIQVLTSNLAISGSGYFQLNRGFIATLVSALITYEVVILQFSVASRVKLSKSGVLNTTMMPVIQFLNNVNETYSR